MESPIAQASFELCVVMDELELWILLALPTNCWN